MTTVNIIISKCQVHYYAGSVKRVFICTLTKVIQDVFSTFKMLEVRNKIFVS